MANENKDVIRVFDTDANVTTALREKMIGFGTDTHKLIADAPGGTKYRYWPSGASAVTYHDMVIETDIAHDGDTDTLIGFTTNKILLTAGNVAVVDVQAAALTINPNSVDVDTIINGNGAELARFDAANLRLGIGTAVPLSQVHIVDAAYPFIRLSSEGSSGKCMDLLYYVSENYGVIQTKDLAATFTPLALNPLGGNVGIVTTSPGCALCVNGGVSIGDDAATSDNNLHVVGEIDAGGDVYCALGVHIGATSGDPGDDNLVVDGTITSEGNVYAKLGLHVGGTGNPGDDNLWVDGTILSEGNVYAKLGLHVGGAGPVGNDNLIVDGSISIGTSTTDGKLDILHTYSAVPAIMLGDVVTNATKKNMLISLRHYLAAEEPVSIFSAYSGASSSVLYIGGEFEYGNAFTAVDILVGSNTTDTTPSVALACYIDQVIINPEKIDMNFIVKGDNEDNLLFIDAGLGRVGICQDTPTATQHVKQPSASGDLPVQALEQTDTDKSFIDFIGTEINTNTASISNLGVNGMSGTGGSECVGPKEANWTCTDMIQIRINGSSVMKYMPVFEPK